MPLTSRDLRRLAREFRLSTAAVIVFATALERGEPPEVVVRCLETVHDFPPPVAGRFPDAVRYALWFPTEQGDQDEHSSALLAGRTRGRTWAGG